VRNLQDLPGGGYLEAVPRKIEKLRQTSFPPFNAVGVVSKKKRRAAFASSQGALAAAPPNIP